MAGSTGFEPATSGLTGQRSNQLNYDPTFGYGTLGRREGEHCRFATGLDRPRWLVGDTGFEPVTPCL